MDGNLLNIKYSRKSLAVLVIFSHSDSIILKKSPFMLTGTNVNVLNLIHENFYLYNRRILCKLVKISF